MSATASTDHIGLEELDAFADGELAPDARERVADHLEDCDTCAQALSGLTESRTALDQLPPLDAPDAFARRVEGRIRRRSRGRFFGTGLQSSRIIYIAAGIVLVILVALYLLSQVAIEVRDARTGLPGDKLAPQIPERSE